jgi:hypothetical protein
MEPNTTSHSRRPYRSLFWPFVFIGVGIVWLLTSFNIIPAENLSILWRLWPVLLIVIGLDMIFGRLSPILGALIGVVAVAAVVAALIAGPTVGLTPTDTFFGIPVVSFSDAELKTDRYTEPLGNATTARVTLDLGSAPTTVTALSDSTNLIDATLVHFGDIDFRVSGDQTKTIALGSKGAFQVGINPASWNKARWDVGLNPKLPLNLTINAGSGHAELDLSGLMLTDLRLDGGSGGVKVSLPAGPEKYTARLSGGSGGLNVSVAQGARAALDLRSGSGGMTASFGKDATIDARLNTGSGGATISLPAGAAARVEVRDSSSGGVHMPAGMKLVDDLRDNDKDTGVWETANFAAADSKISLIVTDLGSGGLTIR